MSEDAEHILARSRMENRRSTTSWRAGSSDRAGDVEAVRDAGPFLAQARATADAARLLPSNRFARAKRLVLRLFRFYTDRQLTYNRSVVQALGYFAEALGRLSARISEVERLARDNVRDLEDESAEAGETIEDLRERVAVLERELESLRASLGEGA